MNLFFLFFGFIILLILVFVNYIIDIKIKQLDSSFKYYCKEYRELLKDNFLNKSKSIEKIIYKNNTNNMNKKGNK